MVGIPLRLVVLHLLNVLLDLLLQALYLLIQLDERVLWPRVLLLSALVRHYLLRQERHQFWLVIVLPVHYNVEPLDLRLVQVVPYHKGIRVVDQQLQMHIQLRNWQPLLPKQLLQRLVCDDVIFVVLVHQAVQLGS